MPCSENELSAAARKNKVFFCGLVLLRYALTRRGGLRDATTTATLLSGWRSWAPLSSSDSLPVASSRPSLLEKRVPWLHVFLEAVGALGAVAIHSTY